MYLKSIYDKEQSEQTNSQKVWQENREQDRGEMIKKEAGEIISDSGGGWISWKILVLRRDLNEQTESCWKSGGRPADLRKWYLRVSKENTNEERFGNKIRHGNQSGNRHQDVTNELQFWGLSPCLIRDCHDIQNFLQPALEKGEGWNTEPSGCSNEGVLLNSSAKKSHFPWTWGTKLTLSLPEANSDQINPKYLCAGGLLLS